MDRKERPFTRVAVLGAGTMGVQLAAHFINSGISTLILDQADPQSPNARIKHALRQLHYFKPEPLMLPERLSWLDVGNYETDLGSLSACDLVVEAIAEDQALKASLYQRIAPYLSPQAVVVSVTDGLSINALSEGWPEAIRSRFCGAHFFNPPRYIKLVELVPHTGTQPEVVQRLEAFMLNGLGKQPIVAKDTPGFIAHRMGLFSMLSSLYHAQRFELNPAAVDLLTGPLIGRSKTATFHRLDLVGLDVFESGVRELYDRLPSDPWRFLYVVPEWISELCRSGRLGRTTGKGVYLKKGNELWMYDPLHQKDKPKHWELSEDIKHALKEKDLPKRLNQLSESSSREALFVWACLSDLFYYCALHGPALTDHPEDIDAAMRWGYGWEKGPFELWQTLGWDITRRMMLEGVHHHAPRLGISLTDAISHVPKEDIYQEQKSYDFSKQQWNKRTRSQAYDHHYAFECVLGQSQEQGQTLWENEGIRLWECHNDRVAILSFKTKKNIIDLDVLIGIKQAIQWAQEHAYRGVVWWQDQGTHFSYGADLHLFLKADSSNLTRILDAFHQVGHCLRYSPVPVVAAVRGMVLGGACELVMHCDRVIAAAETQMGLVEAKIGLIPGGGGCKEFVSRIALERIDADPEKALFFYFKHIAQGFLSTNAYQAQQCGFLRETDVIIHPVDELLFRAKQEVFILEQGHYRPPLPRRMSVMGKQGVALCQSWITNRLEGGFISPHDALVATRVADLLCGGQLEKGTVVHESWILKLEKEAFVSLMNQSKTRERIQHTLIHGVSLKN